MLLGNRSDLALHDVNTSAVYGDERDAGNHDDSSGAEMLGHGLIVNPFLVEQ